MIHTIDLHFVGASYYNDFSLQMLCGKFVKQYFGYKPKYLCVKVSDEYQDDFEKIFVKKVGSRGLMWSCSQKRPRGNFIWYAKKKLEMLFPQFFDGNYHELYFRIEAQ